MQGKRLYRNKSSAKLAGVCSGLADYFEIDVNLIRVLFILAVILGGGGFIVYLLLWIIIPENHDELTPVHEENHVEIKPSQNEKGDSSIILGIILILIGLFFVLERIIKTFAFHKYWPVILILAGIVVIIFSLQKTKQS